ncbi:hypothetical protein ACWGB8_04755 [Kitasatospora sp. NPDC054939]
MARLGKATTEELSVEIYGFDLDEEERQAFGSAPEEYLRGVLEAQGHTVNRVVVDTRILGAGDCPGSWQLLHVFRPPHEASTWIVRCELPV